MITSTTPRLEIHNLRDVALCDAMSLGQFSLRELARGVVGPNLGYGRVRQLSSSSTTNVLGLRDWLKVSRIAARRNAAQMVNVPSFRNRPDHPFIHRSMGGDFSPINRGHTVPLAVETALPNPARRDVSAIFFDVFNRRETAVMSGEELGGLTSNQTVLMNASGGEWRFLSAAATAKTGLVRTIKRNGGRMHSAVTREATDGVPTGNVGSAINTLARHSVSLLMANNYYRLYQN